MSINFIVLHGNLGNDPELKMTSNGTEAVNFSMATETSWKNQDGQWENRPEWHRIQAYGNIAKAIANNLRKGDRAIVIGDLRYNKYTDRDGVERVVSNILAHKVEFTKWSKGDSAPQQQSQQKHQPQMDDSFSDSIPF